MHYPCTMTIRPDGRIMLSHTSRELGRVEVTASTQAEAMAKLRGELQFRLELCPCTGEQYRDLTIEIVADAGRRV